MRIEHIGINVEDPVKLAAWYVENLGMKIVRKLGAPTYTHFLQDSAGASTLEVYHNTSAPVPDYRTQDPLVLHIAFAADDVPGARDRLITAGATPEGDLMTLASGDELAMVRDPWGIPVQLARRAEPWR